MNARSAPRTPGPADVASDIHIAFSPVSEQWISPLAKGFRRMAALALVCRAAFFILSATCAWTPAALAEPSRAARSTPTCLSAAEARQEVRSHSLLEPFAALKAAAAQRKAEALSARLCHAGDEFFYEITLLHRDGRLVHVEMNAGSGKLIPRAPREADKPPAAREAQEPPTK